MSMKEDPVVQSWLHTVAYNSPKTSLFGPRTNRPGPHSLFTSAKPLGQLKLGTGHSIFTDAILPAIETAEAEVILVTCFWARSASLNELSQCLRRLSARSLERGREKIKVRICFSSLSLFQKLFHTSSPRGTAYPPTTWTGKLGLPSELQLSGLDLRIKSLFYRPFSVLHPKYVIIDRKLVFLPSCNVSWEDWFEGCVALSGEVVNQFLEHWSITWADETDNLPRFGHVKALAYAATPEIERYVPKSQTPLESSDLPALFLPSKHHVNPQFSLLPWKSCPPPPNTPLNAFLLAALANAKSTISIQTPNITAPPVLSALLSALRRGTDVEILTSERLMILEQLVTAGTTTKRCINSLTKKHRRLKAAVASSASDEALLEAGEIVKPGKLTVYYYLPLPDSACQPGIAEPVQSHLKLTIIDREWTVLGSGNLDRASWYTSQELGVAFYSHDFAASVRQQVFSWMAKRRRLFYDG